MILEAITVSTDTLIAVLVTAIITGLVPSILLVIKIINDREARISARMNGIAEKTASTAVLERESRANVKELWKERDDLHKEIATLNRSLQNHSQLLKAASPPEHAADSS
jgi:uncharacterized membrane protein (DUF106 family)